MAIAAGLYWYWQLRGHHTEARGWLERLQAAAPDAAPRLRAHALANAGAHAYFQNDLATARSSLESSVALCRASGERWVLGWALSWLSWMVFGAPVAAQGLVEESLAIFEELGDEWHRSTALYSRGMAAARRGDAATEHATFQETIAVMERLGDRWTAASSYGMLGRAAYRDGDYPAACALLVEAVARMREIGDQPGLGSFLNVLGEVTRLQGDQVRAVALSQEAIRLSHQYGSMQGIALGLVRLAAVAMANGQHERAAQLCAAAEALPESARALVWAVERAAYDRDVAAVRARLGDPGVAAAWTQGHTLSLDDAVSEALRPYDPPAAPARPATQATPSYPDGLSAREVEVLRLLATGKSNKEIAEALVISVNTVFRHVTHILDKTGAANRAKAAAYAVRHGLVEAD
jgi:DNA-binding CsgD family transcriptional regulator